MKKLSVFLLAMVFIFGLAAQASAQQQGPYQVSMDAFAVEDPVITFDQFAAIFDPDMNPDGYNCWADPPVPPVTINDQYQAEFGVSFSGDGFSFSEGLYGEHSLSVSFISALAATNFNWCTFFDELDMPGLPVMVSFEEPVTRVGFLGFSPDGGITVTPFRDGVATAAPIFVDTPYGEADPAFIGVEDLDGIDAIIIEAEGDGNLYGRANLFWIDELTFGGTLDTGPTEVTMNVNPPNCSGASINVKSKGVTPVVIAGSKDFDVTMIDLASIQLHGVAPVRSAIEDVPYCNNSGSDGYWDLTLKFDTKDLVDAMEASAVAEGVTLENDDLPVLHLTGSLFDGTAIYADEPVSVKGKPVKENRRSGKMHLRHNKGHHKGWDNNRGHHKGWKNHHGWD